MKSKEKNMNKLYLKKLASLSMIVLFALDCAATANIEKDPSTDTTAYSVRAIVKKIR
jgi:hypothetical protein